MRKTWYNVMHKQQSGSHKALLYQNLRFPNTHAHTYTHVYTYTYIYIYIYIYILAQSAVAIEYTDCTSHGYDTKRSDVETLLMLEGLGNGST